MGKSDFFKIGDWNAICDRCGHKYKASQLRDTWDNFRVCDNCWEPRHPQDFVRSKIDRQRVPWSRDDIETEYTTTTINTTAVSAGDLTFAVVAVGQAAEYMTIGIQLDITPQDASGITGDNVTSAGKVVHWSTIASVSSPNITINDRFPFAAAVGNTVWLMSGSHYLTIGQVTVAGDFAV
jgi:hypothetical protein